jgi:hypothetical protein
MVLAMTTHPDPGPLHIAYVGNFEPEHSTENHVAETLRRMGHRLELFQENLAVAWERLARRMEAEPPDLVLWTRTGWQPPIPNQVQLGMLTRARELDVPTVGFHLDRWWGLQREHEVHEAPFFQCSLVATADGGHDDEWAAAGVNHLWLPPAVAEWQCGWGTPRAEYRSEVAFVGSWESYHDEWPWRRQMVRQVAARYGDRFTTWPKRGQQAVRGGRLRDLYASTTVVVGDSCMAGGASHYWSDRVPETIGRGGLLVHPAVPGMDVALTGSGLWASRDFVGHEPESIEAVFLAIDYALDLPVEQRLEIQRAGLANVMANHTYRNRMEQLLAVVRDLEAVTA